jgi:hypothetical protein
MTAAALYFPKLSLPHSSWVNPAVLFFERIQVIAPLEAAGDLYDARTEQLIEAKVVEPVVPGMGPWDLDADERFIRHLNEIPNDRRRQTAPTRIHLGKLEYTNLAGGLRDCGFVQNERGGWFFTPRWAADQILTYLALQMVTHSYDGVSLVTDAGAAWTLATGLTTQQRQHGRSVEAVAKMLPVAPRAPVEDLLAFRKAHAKALAEFRDYISTLIETEQQGQAGDFEFQQRLSDAARRRDELVQTLKAANLAKAAVTITISALPVAAALAAHDPYAAGAGAVALGASIADQAQRGIAAWQAHHDPLAYAAIAQRRFF